MDEQMMYMLSKVGLAKYRCTWEIIDVYNCGIYNSALDLNPSLLDEAMQGLLKSLINTTKMPFPTHHAMQPNPLHPYKIVGIMRNVKI
mgnify:FL=1